MKKKAQTEKELLAEIEETLHRNGTWDDGCFYYHGVAASELGLILGKIAYLKRKEKIHE